MSKINEILKGDCYRLILKTLREKMKPISIISYFHIKRTISDASSMCYKAFIKNAAKQCNYYLQLYMIITRLIDKLQKAKISSVHF